MKLHRLIGTIAVAAPLGALAAGALVVPLAAQNGRNGGLHIVKDCTGESGQPGTDFCTIVSSNLSELPAGTRIFYNVPPGGPFVPQGPIEGLAGPGYFDTNIFVFVSEKRWAVGRCTGPNNIGTPGPVGLCTLTDGVGRLAGFTARVNVRWTDNQEANGLLFDWDGTYSFNPQPGR
jgi:hypothetical protein